MPKAYWISCYREINDPNKLAAYAKLAGPVIESRGGRYLCRGLPEYVYEQGVMQRTILIEFESIEQALATHNDPVYQFALAALEGGVVRDLRIVPGV